MCEKVKDGLRIRSPPRRHIRWTCNSVLSPVRFCWLRIWKTIHFRRLQWSQQEGRHAELPRLSTGSPTSSSFLRPTPNRRWIEFRSQRCFRWCSVPKWELAKDLNTDGGGVLFSSKVLASQECKKTGLEMYWKPEWLFHNEQEAWQFCYVFNCFPQEVRKWIRLLLETTRRRGKESLQKVDFPWLSSNRWNKIWWYF